MLARHSVTVVIRSVGERTEPLCVKLVTEQVYSEQVFLVRNQTPFSVALSESYSIGIERGLPWTLCLDADVLLFPDAIERLLEEITTYSVPGFGLSGMVTDKFHGTGKSGGPHLYRTEHLERAQWLIPEPHLSLRPETHVKKAMAANGYVWHTSGTTFGFHDYEQYYRDIFRKMVVRANKSEDKLPRYLQRALLLADKDDDFLVALWGLRLGQHLCPETIVVDSEQWRQQANLLLISHAMEEKDPLEVSGVAAGKLKQILERGTIRGVSKQERARVRINRVLGRTGSLLSKLGARMQRRAVHSIDLS